MENRDLDSKVAVINEIINKAVETVIPIAEQPTRKGISAKTLRVKEPSEIMEKYRKMCNAVRTLARKDKQNWIEKQCSNIEQFAGEYKTREVYKLIKSINRKWQPRQTSIKNKDGKILMNREETKEIRTEYCSDLFVHSFIQEFIRRPFKKSTQRRFI